MRWLEDDINILTGQILKKRTFNYSIFQGGNFYQDKLTPQLLPAASSGESIYTGESIFPEKKWLPGSHYILVYYDWGSHNFQGFIIFYYTGFSSADQLFLITPCPLVWKNTMKIMIKMGWKTTKYHRMMVFSQRATDKVFHPRATKQ